MQRGLARRVEVDQGAAFTPPILYSATVTGTSHTPSTALPSNSVLHWRVRAGNTCGTGTDSATFDFTTVPLPGDCPIGEFPQVSDSQGFEVAAPPGWTLPAGTGTNTWAQSAARANSGASSFKSTGTPSVTDQRLVSPTIALQSGLNPLSLIFYHWRDIEEQGAAACYDAGILEVSTDGGATFTQLDAQIQTDPYNGPTSAGFSNPLAGLRAWCAGPVGFNRVVTDVSAYAGQSVQFRFRLGTDSSVGTEGWYIDDFRIQGCSATPPDGLFQNGFED